MLKLHTAAWIGLWLFLPGLTQAEEKTETQKVTLPNNNNCSVEFTARRIEYAGERVMTAGFALFEGKIVETLYSPPHLILSRGVFRCNGKELLLDVSGLTDPWVIGDKIESRMVRLLSFADGPATPFQTLSVCFVKGGAEDYLIEWVLMEGQSFRVPTQALGDSLPDWSVRPPSGHQEKSSKPKGK